MGHGHDKGEAANAAADTDLAPAAEAPPRAGVQQLQVMLQGGVRDPAPVAEVFRSNPSERDPMLQLLNQQVGMGFSKEVLNQLSVVNSADALKPGEHGASEEMAARAPGHAPDTKSYKSLAKYAMLDGTKIADFKHTTQAEADVLNELRHDNKRFRPEFVRELQRRLGISNQSGSINTETIRKLHEKHPGFTAQDLLANKDDVLALQQGDQPFETIGDGFGTGAHLSVEDLKKHGEAKKADGPIADQMARALGYADYKELRGQFTKATILGKQLPGPGVLPHLADRIAMADRWLEQRVKEKHKDEIDKADDKPGKMRQLAGWDGGANTSYGATPGEIGRYEKHGDYVIGPHPHSCGLAIDIDAGANPFVFDNPNSTKDEHWWTESVNQPHLRRSAQLFGGEAITADKMMTWSKSMSTEELYSIIHMASDSFESYLKLANKPDDKIIDAFKAKGFSPDDAEQAMIDLKNFAQKGYRKVDGKNSSLWFDFGGHQNATKLTTHSLEIVVALRDVAGLAWGGTEMNETVNGDFMHFDCRQDGVGKVAQQFFNENLNTVEAAPSKKPT